MSKPISISLGKSKGVSAPSTGQSVLGRKPISFATKPKQPALRNESDDDDEHEPSHEEVTGFAADGAVLSRPVERKDAPVIKNSGNGDWRTRGRKTVLPAEVQAQRDAEAHGKGALVERNELSKASGLQFAESSPKSRHINGERSTPADAPKEMTEDEAALQALLGDGNGERKTNAVILQSENARPQGIDEADDFKADVASRPDIPTLDEYAAMPVEEFGLAMLRGMGQKRKANGEIVNYGTSDANNKALKIREPRGYLGIGAKAAPGAETELGAWGKAEMRKNNKGEGWYTPVMMKDKRTGETITEEEFEARKKISQTRKVDGKEDWRDRRDKNLEKSGRDLRTGDQRMITDGGDYRDQMNEFSRSSSSRQARDGYESSRSRRERSRSRDRSRRDDDDRYRERRRERYHDDDRYDSSSSRRSDHKERERDRDSERDRDRNHRRRDR